MSQSQANPLIIEEINREVAIYAQKGVIPYEINNGECEDLAMTVIGRLEHIGVEAWDVCPENFQEEGWNGVWDLNLLSKHWPDVVAPTGFDWESLSSLSVGHVWITDGKYHYDAECPEGTTNFFNLPIFINHLSKIN